MFFGNNTYPSFFYKKNKTICRLRKTNIRSRNCLSLYEKAIVNMQDIVNNEFNKLIKFEP